MTIAFDAATAGQGTFVSSISWSHTIGSGSDRYLATAGGHENGSDTDITGITYNSLAQTQGPATSVDSGTVNRSELFYGFGAALPAAGSYNVVVTAGGSVACLMGSAISLTGVDASAPEASASNTAESAASITTNITTLTDNAWLVDAVMAGELKTFTAGSGQTERTDQSESSQGAAQATSTKPVATAGATSVQQTPNSSTNRLAHVVIALKNAAAGAANPKGPLGMPFHGPFGGPI